MIDVGCACKAGVAYTDRPVVLQMRKSNKLTAAPTAENLPTRPAMVLPANDCERLLAGKACRALVVRHPDRPACCHGMHWTFEAADAAAWRIHGDCMHGRRQRESWGSSVPWRQTVVITLGRVFVCAGLRRLLFLFVTRRTHSENCLQNGPQLAGKVRLHLVGDARDGHEETLKEVVRARKRRSQLLCAWLLPARNRLRLGRTGVGLFKLLLRFIAINVVGLADSSQASGAWFTLDNDSHCF